MASNTENLNLLMKNPSTDGADTFNVQTMLNENWQKIDNNAGTVAQTLANILKPTTPPIIGLPPSTTPDGMFQALGDTGELHVWRKTVVTGTDIPAGYNVTDTTGVISSGVYGYTDLTITYSDAVDVNDTGGVTLREPTTTYTTTATGFVNKTSEEPKFLSGKFFTVNLLNAPIMYQKPTESWNFSFTTSYVSFNSGYVVKGYPLTPAGTTTTYPVSTNPKAYQEGDDAKAAGYVLGDVVTGKFSLGAMYASNGHIIKYADSVTVSDDGTVALSNESIFTVGSDGYTQSQIQAACAGKFIQYYRTSSGSTYPPDSIYPFNSTPSAIVFVPSDVSIVTKVYDDYDCYAIDRYQPVTGYAAIPAGTTIEYLGKLGDKARVQVVSYVGTGTYGESNPVNITANFKMKFLAIYNMNQNANPPGTTNAPHAFIVEKMETTYRNYWGYELVGGSYGKRSVDGKTVSFYGTSSGAQANVSGYWYLAIAIG